MSDSSGSRPKRFAFYGQDSAELAAAEGEARRLEEWLPDEEGIRENLIEERHVAHLEKYRNPADDQADWVAVSAPFELVEAMVAIRAALVDSPFASVEACCWEATGVLGLRARQLGYAAEWQPANYGSAFHMLLRCGRWLFDPTAEQFGSPGPTVFELADWPWFVDELDPDPSALIAPKPDVPKLGEEAVISCLSRWIEEDDASRRRCGWKFGRKTAIPALLSAACLDQLGGLPADARPRSGEGLGE